MKIKYSSQLLFIFAFCIDKKKALIFPVREKQECNRTFKKVMSKLKNQKKQNLLLQFSGRVLYGGYGGYGDYEAKM